MTAENHPRADDLSSILTEQRTKLEKTLDGYFATDALALTRSLVPLGRLRTDRHRLRELDWGPAFGEENEFKHRASG